MPQNNCLGLGCPSGTVVGPLQPAASAIPGNIGRVKAKCMVWQHDPFLARPFQAFTYRLSEKMSEEIMAEAQEEVSDAQFELGAAILRPIFETHDMFIATINDNLTDSTFSNPSNPESSTVIKRDVDLVGSVASTKGSIAGQRLPGGVEYELNGFKRTGTSNGIPLLSPAPNVGRDIFPHQLWLHVGNFFHMGMVARHPSEYSKSLNELRSTQNVAVSPSYDAFTMSEIQASAIWDYNPETFDATKSIWPYQINKHAPGGESVHWTIEKYTPVWQGQDFFITIFLGDKKPDSIEDNNPPNELVDTNWTLYKYLMHQPAQAPPPRSVDPSTDLPQDKWVAGISNSAFYIDPKRDESGAITDEEREKALSDMRKRYWWKYKNYVLIEIGAGDPKHNYFIELVLGRKPRLLHLGEEWDNPNRLNSAELDPDDFTFMRKCRVLGVYEDVSVEDLFKKPSIGISVRNHLGRLVITFGGREDRPWVISRLDNDPSRFDFTKILVPMVVPAGKLRMHGGNLSCAINYSPTRYVKSETIPFRNRQVDSHEANANDLYMSFSKMGTNIRYGSQRIKNRYFNDSRFGEGNIGYDCDAHTVLEINRNATVPIVLYNYFDLQYRTYGKGWVLNQELGRSAENPTGATQGQTSSVRTRLFGENTLDLGLESAHKLSLINIDGRSTSGFQFGLFKQSDASYPYKSYVSRFDVGLEMVAGSVRMPQLADLDQIDERARSKVYPNFVTPIATSWSLFMLGGSKPVQGKVAPFDISPLVTSITDGWSVEGFTTMNHECRLQCYIPIGYPTGGPPSTDDSVQQNIHALGQKLLKLHNQAFYVTVSYWWEDGVGERDAPGNRIERTGSPQNSDLLIQMTGIAYGAELERSVNKLYMNFTVKDYMQALEHQRIFNSPFFDGVSDVVAIHELAKLAGFDDDRTRSSSISRKPLGFLQKAINDVTRRGDGRFIYNGEKARVRPYDLPGAYNTIVEPAVRFQDGESFASAMTKIASISGKIVFFDRWGVLRFENLPAIEAAFSNTPMDFDPVFNFVTTPFFSAPGGTQPDGTVLPAFTFNPRRDAASLVYNVVTYQRSMEDTINQLVMVTASNDIRLADGTRVGGLIVEGYTFFEQLWDPEVEGFLGYRRPFYQSFGGFGGLEQVRNGLQQYAMMKYPAALISFQTYGVPGLKALDIITLDGNYFYITEISHEIDPAENRWWMNISGEWLKPFLGDLGFLQESEPPTPDDDNN